MNMPIQWRPGQRMRVGGVDICYERHGVGGRPLLLVMGIGAQLVAWPDEFVERFVHAGFEVILFDHRDVGLSTHLRKAPVPPAKSTIIRGLGRFPLAAPYTLAELADDAHGLMRGLGHVRYDLMGVSMGGMIAQMMAIRYPSAVKSLTSIMSTTGQRRHAIGKPAAIRALLRPPPRTREEAGQSLVEFFRVVGSTGYAQDEVGVRARGELGFMRAQNPDGFARHLAAMVATGSRLEALRRLKLPTLVVHGEVDPLVPFRGGVATAQAIPGAEFLPIAGMGHDLPPAMQGRLVEAIRELSDRAAEGVASA